MSRRGWWYKRRWYDSSRNWRCATGGAANHRVGTTGAATSGTTSASTTSGATGAVNNANWSSETKTSVDRGLRSQRKLQQ